MPPLLLAVPLAEPVESSVVDPEQPPLLLPSLFEVVPVEAGPEVSSGEVVNGDVSPWGAGQPHMSPRARRARDRRRIPSMPSADLARLRLLEAAAIRDERSARLARWFWGPVRA